MNNDIDHRLRILLKKEPTADNLNVIGDLYFKKGDIVMANHYFHKAISRMNYAQKGKIIAIYKKIIGHCPDDIKAYEGLLKVLLRTGYVVDELKYLTVLAGLYEEKRDGEKAFFAYRRLYELDPENTHAQTYIEKWEKAHPETKAPKVQDTSPAKTDLSSSDEKVLEAQVERTETGPSEEPKDVSPAVLDSTIMDRASIGLFTVSLDESPETMEDQVPHFPSPLPAPQRAGSTRRFLIPASVALALVILIAGAGAYLIGRHWKQGSSEKETISPTAISYQAIREKRANGFDISIEKVSSKSIGETDLGRYFIPAELQNNVFYAVTIRARQGCLPDSFISSPQQMVAIKVKGSDRSEKAGDGRLSGMNRIIYRSNFCGRDSGAVFMRFFVYHNKTLKPGEFSVSSLEQGMPVKILWEE